MSGASGQASGGGPPGATRPARPSGSSRPPGAAGPTGAARSPSAAGPPGASGFAGTAEALAAVRAGLAFLTETAAGSLPSAELAGCLRELERAESVATAARARVLAAFHAQRVFEADGQRATRSWLTWQTRITTSAASGAIGWMKRLSAHPRVFEALAAAEISPSWARQVCAWSDGLPEDKRDDADLILLAAAAGGVALADLGALAEEMRRRTAGPDRDDDGGFADREFSAVRHFGGTGALAGSATPEGMAMLDDIFARWASKTGPEDTRTKAQRQYDAFEEALRRALATEADPESASRTARRPLVQLHMTLDQLTRDPAAADAAAAWIQAATGGPPGAPGWLTSSAAAQAHACDAKISPVVTGHLDPGVLDRLTADWLGQRGYQRPGCTCGGCTCGGCTCRSAPPPDGALPPATVGRLRDALLRQATALLSGPAGLAAFLRTGLTGTDFPAVSLPLDVGAATERVPPHLRNLVTARDRRCGFPGCTRTPIGCQVHHIIPRSKGGRTQLTNLLLLCSFHHLIVIHRWGWTITLHGDGTTTAVSPDQATILHSHGPPAATAA